MAFRKVRQGWTAFVYLIEKNQGKAIQMSKRKGWAARAKARRRYGNPKRARNSNLSLPITAKPEGAAQGHLPSDVNPSTIFSATKVIAGLIRDLRADKSEDAFAEMLGVTRRDVMLWERGYGIPDPGILRNAYVQAIPRNEGGLWGIEASLAIINEYALRAKERESNRQLLLDPISDQLMQSLRENPGLLYGLSPRKYEEVIAEILAGQGADVTLTPNGRDQGRDIFAMFKTPVGRILTIVQCKRYAPDRRIDRPTIAEFLYTIREQDKANLGLVATTSAFSREAQTLASMHRWQLKLADFNGIKRWLEQYGNWDELSGNLFWTPGE